jgi:hypothetical protein
MGLVNPTTKVQMLNYLKIISQDLDIQISITYLYPYPPISMCFVKFMEQRAAKLAAVIVA